MYYKYNESLMQPQDKSLAHKQSRQVSIDNPKTNQYHSTSLNPALHSNKNASQAIPTSYHRRRQKTTKK